MFIQQPDGIDNYVRTLRHPKDLDKIVSASVVAPVADEEQDFLVRIVSLEMRELGLR